MAVPVLPCNTEPPVYFLQKKVMDVVSETLSPQQEDDVCKVPKESYVGDLKVVSSYKPNQNKTIHTFIGKQSMRKDVPRPKNGLRKYLSCLFERIKLKMSKRVKNPFSKEGRSMKYFIQKRIFLRGKFLGKQSMEKDVPRPKKGLRKHLSCLFERKKLKMSKRAKNPFSKEGRSIKHFIQKKKCLRGEKTNQELKNADSEENVVEDRMAQNDGGSSLSAEIGGKVTPDHTGIVKDAMTWQYGEGNVLPKKINSYGDGQCLSHEDDSFRDVHYLPTQKNLPGDGQYLTYEDDSFRDVHFISDKNAEDLDLSSLLGHADDRVKQYEGVSKTVEADGLGSEITYIDDDECQETLLKEVVPCKQSATILHAFPKADTLKSSERAVRLSNPVQCTEDNIAAMCYARVENQELKSSMKSHCKDETLDSDTNHADLFKLSHTKPFLNVRESYSQVICTDQKKGSSKLDLDDVESLDISEIGNNDDVEDKLECGTMKTETGQYPHHTTPLNYQKSFEEYVFQKQKSKVNVKYITNQFHLSSHLYSATSSSCICSRCEYDTTVGHRVSGEEAKTLSSLHTKPEKGQPQEESLAVSLNLIWMFFIYGFASFLSNLKQMGKLDIEIYKKVSAMLHHHKGKEAEDQNNKLKKWKTDTKQNETNKSQLRNDRNQDAFKSSDVVESLKCWLKEVNIEPLKNQSNVTEHTGNNNIHQPCPAISQGSQVYQPQPSHTLSDQLSSLHRKRKLAVRNKRCQRYHCIRHAVKPILPKSLLHYSKPRTSRRLVKRMNSLERFAFQQNTDLKTIRHDKRRFNYLHLMPDVRSKLNVFMLPFTHPNSQSAVNGANGTDHEQENSSEMYGAAARLSDMENPPSTFNDQISVFEQIVTGTVTESMKFEWARFKSFWSFPMSCPISPTMLAKYGFYYSGNEDKVCCFCCGVIHGGWQKGQSVYATHYQISRRCRFMRGENVGNVPIHGPFSSLSCRGGGEELQLTAEEMRLTSMLQTPGSITSILLGREQDPGNSTAIVPLAQALPTVPSVRTEMRNGIGAGRTSNSQTSQMSGASSSSVSQALPPQPVTPVSTPQPVTPVSTPQPVTPVSTPQPVTSVSTPQPVTPVSTPQPVTPVSTPNPTTAVTQSGQMSAHQQVSSAPHTSTVSQAASNVLTKTASQAQNDTVANQQRPANQQQPTTLAQRQDQRHQEQQQQPLGQQQPQSTGHGVANNPANLGVTTARPRYPNYAVLTVRSSTFHGFPNHLDQTPLQMARAGFFYAGYGDYVRCFFCGGGLRNWEPGDDPWVEHARWFPRCAYVKQNKGQTFINLVLQRQREVTLPNEYVNTTTGASSASQSATTQTARTVDNQTSTGGTPPPVTAPNTTSNPGQTGPTDTQRHSQTPPIVTDEEMTSPAVLSIKEMGYSDEVIKTAIQRIRRDRGPIHISAELLVEAIFGLGDDDLRGQRPNQTQTGSSNVPTTTQSNTTNTNPPKDRTPSSENTTLQPKAGAVSAQSDPRPPRRLRDADSATRAYTEEELKSIQEENNQLKEQMKCKICMDNVVCISFLPCGHLCCCAECAPAMVKCPICRQFIRGSVKTYLS